MIGSITTMVGTVVIDVTGTMGDTAATDLTGAMTMPATTTVIVTNTMIGTMAGATIAEMTMTTAMPVTARKSASAPRARLPAARSRTGATPSRLPRF